MPDVGNREQDRAMSAATRSSDVSQVDRAEAPLQSRSRKIGVLVLEPQRVVHATQQIHATIARLLDRERFRMFAVIPPDCEDRTVWENVPDLTVWTVPL